MKTQRREALGMLTAAVGSALLPASFAIAEQTPSVNGATREAVSDIGGFFFRAHDPKVLARWYQDHLGIVVTPQKADDPVWQQQGGRQVSRRFPRRQVISATPLSRG